MSNARHGNFSSSNIWKLMSNGKGADKNGNDKNGNPLVGAPFKTYVQETRFEMRLGRALSTDVSSRPALWGTLVEAYVNDAHVGLEYELASTERLEHQFIAHWTGAPDLISDDCVGDIKCPQLKNFCELSEICLAGDVFELKASYPEYFWQLVSNAILTDVDYAELIVFCPYQDELAAIRELAVEAGDKFKFIFYAKDDELAYLPRDSFYKNVARLRFNVSGNVKEELSDRVELAVEKLLVGVLELA